jgi:hypothetical protein
VQVQRQRTIDIGIVDSSGHGGLEITRPAQKAHSRTLIHGSTFFNAGCEVSGLDGPSVSAIEVRIARGNESLALAKESAVIVLLAVDDVAARRQGGRGGSSGGRWSRDLDTGVHVGSESLLLACI